MQGKSHTYLGVIINAQEEVRQLVIQATDKAGYQDFQEYFNAITHQIERIFKAVHAIEQIEAGQIY